MSLENWKTEFENKKIVIWGFGMEGRSTLAFIRRLLPDQEIVIADCSEEEPAGRRNLCYDMQARVSRKNNAPADSALEQAQRHGVSLMDEQAYRRLQSLGDFDLKTSCWLSTPETIRAKGGALFGEKRYGQVFIYHNGVQSYYQVRGFRCLLRIRK